MKKLTFIILLAICCHSANAQFDFLIGGLSDIGSTIGGGPGYLNTVNDIKQIEEALRIINESKCLIDNMTFGAEIYEDEFGYRCFDDAEFKLYKAQLDQSAVAIADQLYANSQNILGIIGGLGKGDKETISAVNKTVVSDAIQRAINALLDIQEENDAQNIELADRQSLYVDMDVTEVIYDFVLTPVLQNNRKAQKMSSEGEESERSAKGFLGVVANGLTILLILASVYSMLRSENPSWGTVAGLMGGAIALSIINILVL